jgi:hypothetical protein
VYSKKFGRIKQDQQSARLTVTMDAPMIAVRAMVSSDESYRCRICSGRSP